MKEQIISNFSFTYSYIVAFLLLIIAPQDLHSWDVAVASENGIHLFNLENRKLHSTPDVIPSSNNSYAIAYDSFNERIFFSVNNSIFSYNVADNTSETVITGQSHEIQGLDYDRLSGNLYWTNGNGHSVQKLSLLRNSSLVETVLTFTTDITMGLAISVCQRLLFWTNINHRSASIDRSDLNGKNHIKLITENLFVPLSVTVDDVHHKIYWTDDQKGIYFKIERSNFDGSNREVIVERTHQEPFDIAILRNGIYWTDTLQKNVWIIESEWSSNNESDSAYGSQIKPKNYHSFNPSIPYGIVAFKDVPLNCNFAVPAPSFKTKFSSKVKYVNETKEESLCPNFGERNGTSCKCKKEFSGDLCQISKCHNYCLNGGQCTVNSEGEAECNCSSGYVGTRCEKDLCSGYCLNEGRCFINNSMPVCFCDLGFSGKQCEVSLEFICNEICMNSLGTVMCDCNSSSLFEASMDYEKSLNSNFYQQQHIIIIFLICLQALTILVVAILTRKVCVLRRRPRIKKRIIVNKGVRNQTPLTARPQLGTSEQCEITIENCCNMNICETPCFEPNLRPNLSSPAQLSKKTEEKKNLLKSMESEFEDTDMLYS